jgi:hypothetical protein
MLAAVLLPGLLHCTTHCTPRACFEDQMGNVKEAGSDQTAQKPVVYFARLQVNRKLIRPDSRFV